MHSSEELKTRYEVAVLAVVFAATQYVTAKSAPGLRLLKAKVAEYEAAADAYFRPSDSPEDTTEPLFGV